MNRSGEFVKNLSGELEYRSFRPAPLPPNPKINIDEYMMQKLIQANAKLASLNTIVDHLPNVNLFLSMYVRKEALLTSQIEGTQCTLDDILNPQIDANINLDVEDVINYVNATNFAVKELEKLPLCNRLLKETHQVLLQGIRGEEKNPGEFRKTQNWIGPANCSLSQARYIPPNVLDMEESMSDLEKYLNAEDECDPLIKIALIHYQFETIHPFLDGNGRIGRLLILLFLLSRNLLSKPVLYISYFLKKNQIEYYDRMSEVRRTGNYEQWVNFFLDAVIEASIHSIKTIEELSKLHDDNMKLLKEESSKTVQLFEYLEKAPIIDINQTAKQLGYSYNTVSTAVKKLVEIGILEKQTNNLRNRVFVYEKYLLILRKDTF